MVKSVCILVRKPPYGSMDAAEAVRHINGALAAGLRTRAVLLGDGVYVATRNQDAAVAGWTSLSAAIEQSVTSGASLRGGAVNRAEVYAHGPSLEQQGLTGERLIEGAQVITDTELAEILAGSDSVLVF